jgi:hypothetical protein
MSLRSEILALAFGALLILVTFGDGHIYWFVGNLDTIFGLAFWHALDTFYPVASVAVFLLYGWVKGNGLKFKTTTILLFVSFVTLVMLINIDDVASLLNAKLMPPEAYWSVIMWVYPFYSSIAFFFFGKTQETIR